MELRYELNAEVGLSEFQEFLKHSQESSPQFVKQHTCQNR